MKAPTFFRFASISVLIFTLFVCFQSTSFASKRDTAESKRYFKQGQSYFENGEYAEALASFQMAFHYKKLAGFHFNMAQCQMELGDHEDALNNYKAYLEKKPGASNSALVETRILEAKDKLGLLKPKPKPKPKPQPKVKKIVKAVPKPAQKTKKEAPQKVAKLNPKEAPKKSPSATKATAATTAIAAATPSAPTAEKAVPSAPPPPEMASLQMAEPALIPLVTVKPAKKEELKQTEKSKSAMSEKTVTDKENQDKPATAAGEAEIIAATLDNGAPNADLLATDQLPADILASALPSSSTIEPIYEEWWFWSVTGSVVAASVGAIIYASNGDSEPVVVLPSGSLGRIDRR